MKTTVTLTTVAGLAAAQSATYACNQAHQYPAGQVCTIINGSLTLVTLTGTAAAQQTYACNPAHQYPEGQKCETIDGSLTLVTVTGAAATNYPSASCPDAGSTNSNGQYSCNPAHQYPAGQSCELQNGCYILVTTSTPAATPYPSASAAACPPAGSTNSNGQYSCNPAHQYPAGQTCQLQNNCYVLVTSTSAVATTSASASSGSCPAAGSTNSNGQYSCNPAHQYPAGQTCQLESGCYVLVTTAASGTVSPSLKPTVASISSSAGSAIPVPSAASSTHAYVPSGAGSSATGSSDTGSAPASSIVPYTGAADKLLASAGATFAGLLAVFAL